MSSTLVCTSCRGTKPVNLFEREPKGAVGRKRQCRDCINARRRERRKLYGPPPSETPERRREAGRRYRERNREKTLAAQRRSKYNGISDEEYRSLLEGQEGSCAICRRAQPLQVDHNHATGQIRGLLCGSCNRALGLFGDDSARLASAVIYLGGT